MVESKASRRGFLSAVAAGVVGLAVGGGVGWSLKAPEVREKVQTVTVTGPGRETTLTVTREVTKEVTPVKKLPRDVVKIGVLGIRSGPWATYGTFIEQGARLAAEEINSAGGILGSRI
ncbi:MAG: ABC transporter substrate-binding protein, partial [Candidatus Caldarchaeum sp.]